MSEQGSICSHLDQLILSAEPGEDWSWCYVDEVAFRISPP